MRRVRERGSAMLVTLILIASLLAGAAVLVSMQLSSNNAADMSRSSTAALHCAEAGLSAARPAVVANMGDWSTWLAVSAGGGCAANPAPCQPTWLDAVAIDHDVDDSGSADDFVIYLEDNNDEFPPLTNDQAVDNDLTVYIVSRCTIYPDTPKEVRELVNFTGGGKMYDMQKGGAGKNGNRGAL